MADTPLPWGAYQRVQLKLSTTRCITAAAALEEALNVVHQPDFDPKEIGDLELVRVAETAARRDRHRAYLLRSTVSNGLAASPFARDGDDSETDSGPRSLDDEVHARRELAKLKAALREPDWDLLTGIAAGVSYEEFAAEQATSTTALRSRVSRLRRAIGQT